MRSLPIAAVAEAASLAVLLVNLVTAHTKPITTLVGPLHGTAYLMVIALTFAVPAVPPAARWLAVIPGFGGLLAVRRIHAARGRDKTGGWRTDGQSRPVS